MLIQCQPSPTEQALMEYQQFIESLENQRYIHHRHLDLDSVQAVHAQLRHRLDSLLPSFSEDEKQRYQTLVLRYTTLYEIVKQEFPVDTLEPDLVAFFQLRSSDPLAALGSLDSLPYFYRYLHSRITDTDSPSSLLVYRKALSLLHQWKTYYIDSLKPETLLTIQLLEAQIDEQLHQGKRK